MTLIENLRARKNAMRIRELAELLDYKVDALYKMAADGRIPSMHIGYTVRFDPQEIAKWIEKKSR